MDGFLFRNADKSDYDNIKSLCDRRYGTGYLTEALFDSYLECEKLFITALKDGEFAGFAVMTHANEEHIAENMKMPIDEVRLLSHGMPPLIFRSHAILEKFEKMGLPVNMTAALMREGKKQGCGTVFASAWMYDGKIPMGKTFDRLGYQQLYIRENLWYDNEDYCCVVCGGRCRCKAMIYVKNISEWEG